MTKLSVTSIQKRLIEADEMRKVSYEKPKKNPHQREVGKLSDPSTQITNIKQIRANELQPVGDEKGKSFVPQSDFAGVYADKMDHGIFGATNKNEKSRSTPSSEKMKPNQKTNLKKVNPNMAKTTREGKNYKTLMPQADFAQTYVDKMPLGDIYSKSARGKDEGVKPPKATDLGATTRPKRHEVKKPDLNRWPHKGVTGPRTGELQADPKGEDAGSRTHKVEKVKSGALVRVNERIKAKFDLINEDVLSRIVNNYRRFGYDVVVESTDDISWKRDRKFLSLVFESVSAKFNLLPEYQKAYRSAALKRLFELVRGDYNEMYESRGAFMETVQTAYMEIERRAEEKYRNRFDLFEGKARIYTEHKVNDVELLSEAVDHQMALRLIRNTLLEHFGLNAKIAHIFVDGKKYDPKTIQSWKPRMRITST